ncbi:MAG TPA: metal ABC transporter substrate-binding protein [Thermomicrobiales bacterium]|nr:metal ABC transporter substrate-binding protein [Thermomicrobiales bacterium]
MDMRMGRRAVVVAALGLSVALPTVGEAQNSAVGEPLRVVATFSILGDLVAAVGGDAIVLETIVDAGTDAHTFEPAPDDAIALSEAHLVFANGVGFEPWLDELAEGADEPLPVVAVGEGLDLREAGAGHGDEGGAHEGEHAEGGTPEGEAVAVDGGEAHDDEADGDEPNAEEDLGGDRDHGAYDPHVWHDVRNAIAMTETIRAALAAADPANADRFDANAAAFLADLETLDAWVIEQVATLPEERRKLVTSHDTFGYFADRYGFEVVGTALDAASTEGGGPAAREIADLVGRIEAAGVPAIFAENVQNPEVMESIAEEAGVSLAPTLYTDALGAPGGEADSYEALDRHTVETLDGALGGSRKARRGHGERSPTSEPATPSCSDPLRPIRFSLAPRPRPRPPRRRPLCASGGSWPWRRRGATARCPATLGCRNAQATSASTASVAKPLPWNAG